MVAVLIALTGAVFAGQGLGYIPGSFMTNDKRWFWIGSAMVVVGVALWIMGVPLAVPLAVVVFVAAFVPLVGLLVAGALAIVVTLATKGWVDAVVLLGILVIEDQLEAHLLQPQVVGKMIRLHPLAVILSLAAGGVLAGIPGAVVAVPIVAVITRALPELRRSEPEDLGPEDP